MPKHFFKRYLPNTEHIKEHKFLRLFGKRLHDNNLWHLNQYSVATAFSIGLFCAFMPMPFQMVLACFFAIVFRANLPLSIALVWVSNPITMPAMFYFSYKLGGWITHTTTFLDSWDLSWNSLKNGFEEIWPPLLVGTFICGITSAVISNLAIRLFWRIWVIRRWRARARCRQKDLS